MVVEPKGYPHQRASLPIRGDGRQDRWTVTALDASHPADKCRVGGVEVEGEREAGLVLIVDDDPDICDLVAFALELYLNIKTARAGDGEQALELVGKLKPDLVLLDIRLPRVNGLEVARRLKADPQTLAIPLVAITSTPLAPTIIAGCDCYFAKALELFGLVEKLKDCFDAKPDPGAAA